MLSEEEIRQVSGVLSALGNPTRLRIVLTVSEVKRPLHIKAVANMLKKDYAAVYRHVKILQKSGLIEIYEVGRSRVLYPKNLEYTMQLVEIARKTVRQE